MSRKQSNCPRHRERHVERLESRTLFAAGDPDASFGSSGVATINFPGAPFIIQDVALQSDGKLVVAGSKGGILAVTRLNVNGSLDTTFASGGLFEFGGRPFAAAVAIQSDGKIVLAFDVSGSFTGAGITRLTANGSLDTTFGSSGGVVRPGVYEFGGMTIQHDDKIIVVGQRGDVDDDDFGIARLTSTGSPDNSFDGDGLRQVAFGNESETATAVAVDYNGTPATNPFYGTIVVAGNNDHPTNESTRVLICRLLSNGSLDNRFDNDGKLTSPELSPQPGESATGVLIQPGGKIIVSGTALALGGGNEVGDFLLARYLSGGALDTSFGPFGDGIVQTDLGFDDRAADVALSLAGGLLLSGTSGVANPFASVAAYTYDGLLDARFGGGDGILRSGFTGTGHAVTTRDATDPVRRLILAGSRSVARHVDVAAVVTLGAGATETNEATGPTLNVFVARPDRAPVSLRVYVNIGGTATGPIFGNPVSYDYSAAGITLPGFNVPRAYVDIPAGEAFTTFSITPINDTRIEGDETIVVSVSTDPTYDIGSPATTTLVIRDDDVVAGPTVAESNFLYETAPQRVTFRFNQNVASSVGADDFEVTGPGGNVPFGFAYDATLNTATLTFSAIVADGDFAARAVAVGITNASGQPMPADHVLSFSFLRGDANHDRRVNLADFNILAANFGQSNRTFSQGDFNYDARVNLADFNILASRFGTALGGPGRGPADGGADDEEEQSELLRELS